MRIYAVLVLGFRAQNLGFQNEDLLERGHTSMGRTGLHREEAKEQAPFETRAETLSPNP